MLCAAGNVESITSQDATHNLLNCLALHPFSPNVIARANQEFVAGEACQVGVSVGRLLEVHKRHLGLDIGTEDWKRIPHLGGVLLVLAQVRVLTGEAARRLRLRDTLPMKSSSINVVALLAFRVRGRGVATQRLAVPILFPIDLGDEVTLACRENPGRVHRQLNASNDRKMAQQANCPSGQLHCYFSAPGDVILKTDSCGFMLKTQVA